MSNLLAVKLRRDLRAIWVRLGLMAVAIAVSLTVFSGVLFTWSAAARESTDAYLSTEPASATILFGPSISDEQMAAAVAAVRDRPDVIEATGRTQFTVQVTVDGQPIDQPMQVFVAAPGDPMRMATFEVVSGSWPPAAGELMVGGDSLDLLDLAIGDTVVIERTDAAAEQRSGFQVEPMRLRVSAAVNDPSLAPAPQEQTGHGYLSTASLAALGVTDALDQLKIQVGDEREPAVPSRDRATVVAAASQVAAWLEREQGLVVREIQVPEPYAHPHQGQTDSLLLSILAAGGIALLLSTILVATMLNGIFAQQIPQIGIMKALGARSARIGRLYLAMTLLVAAAATLLAVPLGILIGRAGFNAIMSFLGIESANPAPAGWTYLVVLAAGLLLPPVLALVPLVRTSRTTVRAAIDHSGMIGNPGATTGVLAWLGRVRGFDRGLLMALRNTFRRPARFALSVGLLAGAGVVFVAGMSLGDGLAAIQEEDEQQRSWDVNVQLAGGTQLAAVAGVVAQVPDVARLEGLTVVGAGISGPGEFPVSRTYPDQGHGRLAVVAVPAGSTMFAPPTMAEGSWLAEREAGAIVINQVTRANYLPDVTAGDTVELTLGGNVTSWQVVGIAEERGGSGGGYVTAAGLAAAMGEPPQVNQLRIATRSDDEQTRVAVAEAVDEALTAAGVEVRLAASVSRSDDITEGHLGPIILVVLAIAITMATIGCIGLASTMSANVLERTREFGVMHAIGARPKEVRRVVVGEAVFLALASCLVAILPALGLISVLGAGLGNLFMYAPLPYRVSVPAAGIWVALVVLGAILATQAAATRASRITVREALAHL